MSVPGPKFEPDEKTIALRLRKQEEIRRFRGKLSVLFFAVPALLSRKADEGSVKRHDRVSGSIAFGFGRRGATPNLPAVLPDAILDQSPLPPREFTGYQLDSRLFSRIGARRAEAPNPTLSGLSVQDAKSRDPFRESRLFYFPDRTEV